MFAFFKNKYPAFPSEKQKTNFILFYTRVSEKFCNILLRACLRRTYRVAIEGTCGGC